MYEYIVILKSKSLDSMYTRPTRAVCIWKSHGLKSCRWVCRFPVAHRHLDLKELSMRSLRNMLQESPGPPLMIPGAVTSTVWPGGGLALKPIYQHRVQNWSNAISSSAMIRAWASSMTSASVHLLQWAGCMICYFNIPPRENNTLPTYMTYSCLGLKHCY